MRNPAEEIITLEETEENNTESLYLNSDNDALDIADATILTGEDAA